MPRPRSAMRKIREVLRLTFSQGLSRRQVGQAVGLPPTTVFDYVKRAEATGLATWPLPDDVDDAELERLLFVSEAPAFGQRPLPDWRHVHRELRRKGVTLQLLHMEYKELHPDGFQYTWFTQHYREYARRLDVVMRHEHIAGKKMFVDFPGETVPIYDAETEAVVSEAQIFVSALGASNYIYAEALPSQQLVPWVNAHAHAFAFYGGCPEIVVPDNLPAGVTKAHRYEPVLNDSYLDMATHFGVAIIPARPRRPRDKAKVEVAVLLVERWILARLRNRRFYSLGELNAAIRELLVVVNKKPFKKLPGSRQSVFDEIEKAALRPLPARRYEFASFAHAKVHIDYHVEVDYHYYSVPYQHAGQHVDVRLSATTVEVFLHGRRIAGHLRSYRRGRHTTDLAHMPESHRRHLEWPPHRLLSWAEKTGPQTAALFAGVMESRPHPEQGYRTCLGILRLGKRYGPKRLEAACGRALTVRALSYRSLESILKNGLDQKPLPEPARPRQRQPHDNLRGPDYYQLRRTTVLRSPTLDKLHDLNLMGMARAFQEQLERADYQALPFEDRLGMLVDVELQDRENRRLQRYLKAARLRDNACLEDIDYHLPRGLNRALILELADARWVHAHQSVLVTGATGVGKTYVACALAQAAIRRGHTALYLRFPRMIDELAVARVDGRLPRLLSSWARIDVLVLDDFAMQPLSIQQSADLLEVVEDRAQRRATVVTSQLPVKQWHEAWAMPPSPTPSWTDSCITPTASTSAASPCATPRTGHSTLLGASTRAPGAPIAVEGQLPPKSEALRHPRRPDEESSRLTQHSPARAVRDYPETIDKEVITEG